MHRSIASSLVAALAAAPAVAQSLDKACVPVIQDAADPGACVPASTIPTPGALLPLGPEFFVTPLGQVGINTMAPTSTLEVAGDLRVDDRVAIGNAAGYGPGTYTDWSFDLSAKLDDFSAALQWTPLRSYVHLDPPMDQDGPDAKYVYSHDFVVQTVPGSDKNFEYVQGPYMLALHEGTERVTYLAGALAGAENNHGRVDFQAGAYMVSIADWEAETVENAAAELQSGHWGTLGSIENDYGLYVYTPYTDSPLTNHYGIYLEDQDRGKEDSYAIYAAGGTTYLAGDLGIGTDTPAAKLDVAGDFVASGTKSFVEPHPYDPTKEIRFVCLEGNEAGTYFRGRARLVDGEAVIAVPEDFALVSEAAGMTVQVTARGPGADLWVAESGLDRVVVRGARDVEFDYFVNGVRAGYADFETIRDRAAAPSNAAARGARSPERERGRANLERRLREEG